MGQMGHFSSGKKLSIFVVASAQFVSIWTWVTRDWSLMVESKWEWNLPTVWKTGWCWTSTTRLPEHRGPTRTIATFSATSYLRAPRWPWRGASTVQTTGLKSPCCLDIPWHPPCSSSTRKETLKSSKAPSLTDCQGRLDYRRDDVSKTVNRQILLEQLWRDFIWFWCGLN